MKKKNLTIKDFTIKGTEETSYVAWKDIEQKMSKREFKKFMKWMSGQTCIPKGVYPWDLDNYLKGGTVWD